jgi:hypothetical protein
MSEQRDQSDESDDSDPYHSELAVGGTIIAECSNTEDAWFLVWILKEQGVQAAVSLPGKHLDLRGSQVKVARDDEEKARFVLSQGVPAGKREAYDSEPEVEPEPLPACPHCGAGDLVLHNVDTANHWCCEECGTKWDDTPLLP